MLLIIFGACIVGQRWRIKHHSTAPDVIYATLMHGNSHDGFLYVTSISVSTSISVIQRRKTYGMCLQPVSGSLMLAVQYSYLCVITLVHKSTKNTLWAIVML